jgi:hypothetical protein
MSKTEGILFTKRRPAALSLAEIQHTPIPWSRHNQYLDLVFVFKLLSTKHLLSVTCEDTGALLHLSPTVKRLNVIHP